MVKRSRIPRLGRERWIVVAGNHRGYRVRVNSKYHEDVDDTQDHDREHGNEVPVTRPYVPAKHRCEPGKLHRLPDGDSSENRKRSRYGKKEIRGFLQRIVLPLMRMILAPESVELDHLPAVANVTFARNEIAPLAMQVYEGEVNESVHNQHPHHREVPVPCSAQPATEREPGGNGFVLERIAAEDLAFPGERRVGVEDAQTAADHDDDGNEVHPVRDADDPVVTFLIQGTLRGRYR